MTTLYEELGGDRKVRAVISDFVGRVFADVMIGFMFRKVNRQRLEELEAQMAARFLGAEVRYEGRDLASAHARHKVQGGQFARRRQILVETLADHGVPAHIQAVWLDHTDRLRGAITGQPDAECD